MIFEDPFNKTIGKDNFIEIFREMFEKLESPFFIVTDYFISENSDNKYVGYLIGESIYDIMCVLKIFLFFLL